MGTTKQLTNDRNFSMHSTKNMTQLAQRTMSVLGETHLGDVIVDKLVSVAWHRFTELSPLSLSAILITVHT